MTKLLLHRSVQPHILMNEQKPPEAGNGEMLSSSEEVKSVSAERPEDSGLGRRVPRAKQIPAPSVSQSASVEQSRDVAGGNKWQTEKTELPVVSGTNTNPVPAEKVTVNEKPTTQSSKEGTAMANSPKEQTPSVSTRTGPEIGHPDPPVKTIPPGVLDPLPPVDTGTKNKPEEEKIDISSMYAPTWICKGLRTCLLVVAAIALFFIVTQTASFLANVRHLSLTEQILLAVPLVIFGCIVIWFIVKVLRLLFKLRVSPQIKIKAIQELEERKSLRNACLKNSRESVEKLSRFLQESFYADEAKLKSYGASPETIKALKNNRNVLIQNAENQRVTSQDWIHDFCSKIQDPLDQIAKKRILNYSCKAAIRTGISPFPTIDRLIVLSASLAMLKELLEIYSLKPSWDKNLILMGKVIINTYLAGIIEDVAEAGMDGVASFIAKIKEDIPDFALRLGSDIAGKVAGAGAQGYMVYRLGKAAVKVLHPVRVPEDESIFSSLMEKIKK